MTDVPGPLTLFLLPYAGAGAAMYRAWPTRLPNWIRPVPVNLAGRGVRMREAAILDWPGVIADLLPQLGNAGGRYAIFGHSLGALVAFELARVLQQRGVAPPSWIGVSGCAPPGSRVPSDRWRDADDASLEQELRRLGGMPPVLLDNPDFLALVMPVIRADFHLAASYHRQAGPTLDLPMLILAGTHDEPGRGPVAMRGWARETTGPVIQTEIAGTHFFIDEAPDVVIAAIADALRGSALTHGAGS